MTSPRQRKKRLAFKRMQENLEQKTLADHKAVSVEKQVEQKKQETPKPVAVASAPVVESEVAQKQKKSKTALVELKPQEQVVEQQKEQVKTETKE